MLRMVGCGGGGWVPQQKKIFVPKIITRVHFDAVFNRQKTLTVTWNMDFTVQSRNEAYKNSAKTIQTRGQSNLTKSASRGAHSPGGRKLYH